MRLLVPVGPTKKSMEERKIHLLLLRYFELDEKNLGWLDECPEIPDRPEQIAEYSQPLFSVSEWHDLSLKGKALS